MLGEENSGEKPRQRGRKGGQRGQKAGKQASPPVERIEDQGDPTGAAMASIDAAMMEALGEGASTGDAGPADVPVVEEVAAVVASPAGENVPVNMQTIVSAYRDYARKSLQANRAYAEKLMGVRSLDKAVEVQTDFATQTYANFVTGSQRICGLYSELAKQTLSRKVG
jgi:hypothetical protein